MQLTWSCRSVTVTPVTSKPAISIKQLHAKTGEHVRRAGRSRRPVAVTDRGKVVAVLGGPELLTFKKRRKRVLPQNYIAFLAKLPSSEVQKDLDKIRGERL